MEPFLITLMWGAVIAGVGAFLIFNLVSNKKRRQGLEQFAQNSGIEFQERLSTADQRLFDQFALSQKGRNPKARNAIVADAGNLRMVAFDFQYTTGSGKNQSTRRQSVLMTTGPQLQLPKFTLSPESLIHRIGDFFGFKDIDFDDDPHFSKQFQLHGDMDASVREYFAPERRHALLQYPKLHLEGNGNTFLFFQPGKRWKVNETTALMERNMTLYKILRNQDLE